MPVQIVPKSYIPKHPRKTVNGAISYGCTHFLMPTRSNHSGPLPLLNTCFLGETGYSPTFLKVRVMLGLGIGLRLVDLRIADRNRETKLAWFLLGFCPVLVPKQNLWVRVAQVF